MAIHTGTHMDAPCHLTPDQNVQRQHEVPITRFFGPGAVIDIRAKVDSNRDYAMTMDDMREWEDENGAVPDGAIVLVGLCFQICFISIYLFIHILNSVRFGYNAESKCGTRSLPSHN